MPPRNKNKDVIDRNVADLSDESEYDELAESEPEDDSAGKTDIRALLKGQLAEPRHKTWTTQALHDEIHLGTVDLEPSYQRDIVWNQLKMIKLIQSMFMNYYVPPIIFAVHTDEETGIQKRICIDGKQRCTSILYFMDGKIPFISPHSKERYRYKPKVGTIKKSGKPLPQALRQRFSMFQLQLVEYDGLDDDKQRDIFQRVQLGVALSAAEKLQAIPGEWTNWVYDLLKTYILPENALGSLLKIDISRAKPFQMMVAVVMMCFEPSRSLKPTAATMGVFLQRIDTPQPEFRKQLEKAMDTLMEIAKNHNETAFGGPRKNLAPVEFWFTVFLIYTRMGCMSIENLAASIKLMRNYVRELSQDVFANTKVMLVLYEFLSQLRKTRLPNEEVAAEEYAAEKTDARSSRVNKRRRGDDSYLEEGEATQSTTQASQQARAKPKIPKVSRVNSGASEGEVDMEMDVDEDVKPSILIAKMTAISRILKKQQDLVHPEQVVECLTLGELGSCLRRNLA